MTETEDYPPVVNVLSEEKKQQVLALGRLGWSLRRIERAVHLRRETAATYLKAAGIPVRPPGGWGRAHPKPAIEVSTDPGHENGPAGEIPTPASTSSASACEPFREFIEAELTRAGTPWPLGKIWWTATASPKNTPASNASCGSYADPPGTSHTLQQRKHH